MAKTVGGAKSKTKKRQSTKKTKIRKATVKKTTKSKKIAETTSTSNIKTNKYDSKTRSVIMWVLVVIFTVIFAVLAVFSLNFQMNNVEGEDDKSFFSIFEGVSESTDKLLDNFKNIREALFGEEEEIEVTDEKLNEWEDKLFIDFNQD